MQNKFIIRIFSLFLMAIVVSGCSSTKNDTPVVNKAEAEAPETEASKSDVEVQTPVETLYLEASRALANDKLIDAANKFNKVEREYPYSQWATRSQLMSAYTHYRNLKYDEAIIGLERFIQLHPGDKNIAYANYLRALCFYEQISDVRRDQKMTKLALNNLDQVVSRFPNSKYARDAQLKKDLTLDHLAGKEMEIGRYYLYHHQYQAAVNRFQRVADDYQTTTHVPEALHRLVETYMALGISLEAQKSAAVLGHNFPNSSWYKDSYRLLKGDYKIASPNKEKTFYEKTLGKVF